MAQVTQPFNYLKAVQNPAQEALQAFQGAYQARQQQQNEMFRSAFNEFARKPNKGVSDYVQLLQVTPPEMVAGVKASFDAMTKEQQDVAKRDMARLAVAFKADPEYGKTLLATRRDAAMNAGDREEAQSLETLMKLADVDSSAVLESLALQGSLAFGKDFAEMVLGKPVNMPKLKDVETFSESGLRIETYENGMRKVYDNARFVTDLEEAARLEKAARVRKETIERKGTGKRSDLPGGITVIDYSDGTRDVYRGSELIADPKEAYETAIAAIEKQTDEPLTGDQKISQENVLRKEWINASGDTQKRRNSYEVIKESAKLQSGEGDISLIFAYMKMLDPGSTVMQGEQATAKNAAGVDERLRTVYNNWVSGDQLSGEQRSGFVEAAGKILLQSQRLQNEQQTRYQEIIDIQGLNPKTIFVGVKPLSEEEMERQVQEIMALIKSKKPNKNPPPPPASIAAPAPGDTRANPLGATMERLKAEGKLSVQP